MIVGNVRVVTIIVGNPRKPSTGKFWLQLRKCQSETFRAKDAVNEVNEVIF